jgi:hypothetical protein
VGKTHSTREHCTPLCYIKLNNSLTSHLFFYLAIGKTIKCGTHVSTDNIGVFLALNLNKQDKKMFVLTLWSVRVTIVAMDVGLHVAVNNIKPLSVVIETQERVPFAAVELPNISYCHQQYKHTWYSCQMSDIVVRF